MEFWERVKREVRGSKTLALEEMDMLVASWLVMRQRTLLQFSVVLDHKDTPTTTGFWFDLFIRVYYRLKVVEIHLPSLRDRRNDIPLLLEHFLKKFNRTFGRDIGGISTDAFNVLMQHAWPGNVRELENTIEHAFVRCRQSAITVDHLPQDFGEIALQVNSGKGPDGEQQEAQRIRGALIKADWNKTRAAELLGMSRRTIYRKIDQYGIFVKT